MGFIKAIKERTEVNERTIQGLKEFQTLTSNSNYKEILLCQIKHSSTKREKKLLARFATDILGWLDTSVHSEGGTMASKVNGLTEKYLKYKNYMNKLITLLDGKKTYIAGVLFAVLGVVKAFGLDLTPDQDLALLSFIGAVFAVGIGGKLDKLK